MVSGGDAEGDTLIGFERVIGSAHDDTLASSTSAHRLEGGQGNDIYLVGNQGVILTEAAFEGDDEVRTSLNTYSMASYGNIERLTFTGAGGASLTGNGGDNIITGGTGNDGLHGGAGADQLIGGIGNDNLYGGTGADQLVGGDGTDTANYSTSTGNVTINLQTGNHTGEALGDTFDSIERFVGTDLTDTFIDNATAYAFDGGDSILDTISYALSSAAVSVNLTAGTGSAGDANGDTYVNIERVQGSDYGDTLTSSTSGHRLQGGQGNDTYIVGHTGVIITEVGGEGIDEIRTSVGPYSIATVAAVENLTYTGTLNAVLTGNDLDNVITGNTGNDTLNGGGGADQLVGGIGNDTMLGGEGADQFLGGDGDDTVSYADSTTGIVLDFNTGNHTGIANGDTYDSIEKFVGTGFRDRLVATDDVDVFDGGAAVDVIDYSAATAGFSMNLATAIYTGIAAGDELASFEVVVGSDYDDTFTGDSLNNIFVGGAGADTFDGGLGTDSVAYSTSFTGVTIDLVLGTQTGDAAGDTFTSIERIIGSNFVDTFTGGSGNDWFEGGEGADIIDGGDGNDTIYASHFTDIGSLRPTETTQDDKIRGGNGNDTIYGDGMNSSGTIDGEGGNDTIRAGYAVAEGGEGDDTFNDVLFEAYGENGNDTLNGRGLNFKLFGGDGEDVLNFGEGLVANQDGEGYGGEGDDEYFIYTREQVTLKDDGTTGDDIVYLMNINRADVRYRVEGNDIHISSLADFQDNNVANSGIIIKDWFNGGFNSIETFVCKDGLEIPGTGFILV